MTLDSLIRDIAPAIEFPSWENLGQLVGGSTKPVVFVTGTRFKVQTMGKMLSLEVSGCEFGFEAEKIDPLAK